MLHQNSFILIRHSRESGKSGTWICRQWSEGRNPVETINHLIRFAGEGQHPVINFFDWILAYASMTVIIIFSFINPAFADPPQGPNLGMSATPEQIVHWDIGVMPDGEGLPEGQGSAKEGKRLYEKLCVSCHGPGGIGDTADQLAGAKMPLTSDFPEQTIGSYWPYATTIFDMTRRSMPMDKPGTLGNDEVYAITAYLLYLNNIIGENDVMNAETLPKVEMPNRDGFINVYELEKGRK